jgi:hypothetical protein
MKLRYSPRAWADLLSYGRYLRARSPRGAAEVIDILTVLHPTAQPDEE